MAIKTRAPKIGKQSLWNKVAIALLDGEPKTPAELKAFFQNDSKVSYFIPNRLSTIQWQIRTFEGGVIKVTKNGKTVTSYQLCNAKDFDKNGFGPLRRPDLQVKAVAKPVENAVEPTEVLSVTEETAKVTE